MSTCRSCRRPVTWARNRNTGRRMPIDVDPVDDGNLTLLAGTFEVLTGIFLEQARDRGDDLYMSHFATCPQASEWQGDRR